MTGASTPGGAGVLRVAAPAPAGADLAPAVAETHTAVLWFAGTVLLTGVQAIPFWRLQQARTIAMVGFKTHPTAASHPLSTD